MRRLGEVMHLVSMIYASRTKDVDDDVIDDILHKARTKNPIYDLTGVLLYNSTYFVQCLEGSRSNINRLYNVIAQDPRHEDPIILEYHEILARSFSRWSMAYIGESEFNESAAFRYSTHKTFNPYEMTADSARAFLNDMVDGKRLAAE